MTTDLKRPDGAQSHEPNCGVTAVAVAAGIPFGEAWELCRNGRNANWRGYTVWQDLVTAMKTHKKVNEIEAPPVTLARFARDYTRPGLTYIVRTGGHIQVVCGENVLDQTVETGRHIDNFWGRRKRVTHVMEVR